MVESGNRGRTENSEFKKIKRQETNDNETNRKKNNETLSVNKQLCFCIAAHRNYYQPQRKWITANVGTW